MNIPAPPRAGFFAEHTVAALGADLRAGRVSAGELLDYALEAATQHRGLNTFVTLDPTGARVAARRADRELAKDLDRGPLQGIPVAVKDVIATAGLATTMGSRHFAGHIPSHDAACVARLRAAGAVLVGKTTTHEFADGPTGDCSVQGPTHNPYRPGHIAGGSSAGSAAAVAAGIVPLSLGTDTGGSIRIPAACCGITGLKPTHGVIPTAGVFPLAPSLDTVGPLARTAGDARLLWQTLLGHPSPPGPSSDTDPSFWRIAWIAQTGRRPPGADAVAAAARAALATLPAAVSLTEIAYPELAALQRAYRVLQGREAYAVHAGRIAARPEGYQPEVLARLRAGAHVDRRQLREARRVCQTARRRVSVLLDQHDLLALPTVPLTAPPIGARTRTTGEHSCDIPTALLSLTSPFSVFGLPALSAPAGLVEGLPVGLQLVGPAGGEARLLNVAAQLASSPPHPQAPQPRRPR